MEAELAVQLIVFKEIYADEDGLITGNESIESQASAQNLATIIRRRVTYASIVEDAYFEKVQRGRDEGMAKKSAVYLLIQPLDILKSQIKQTWLGNPPKNGPLKGQKIMKNGQVDDNAD